MGDIGSIKNPAPYKCDPPHGYTLKRTWPLSDVRLRPSIEYVELEEFVNGVGGSWYRLKQKETS
jgi:hypothetical protein